MKKLILIILLCAFGCNEQSPCARYIDGMNIGLHSKDGIPSWRLDRWSLSYPPLPQNQEIYSADFGINVDATSVIGHVSGVTIKCKVTHCGPLGDNLDIWGMTAPNGKPYKYVSGYPQRGSTWNPETGWASAKTNPQSSVVFAIGAGDPNVFDADPLFAWPGGCSEMILTGVKLEIIVEKPHGHIKEYAHCLFSRPQCAGFFMPTDASVYNSSYSALGPPPDIWGLPVTFTPTEISLSTPVDYNELFKDPPPRERFQDCPLEFESLAITQTELPWFYLGGLWVQQVYDPYLRQWEVIEATDMTILPSPDPNIPNDANEILYSCEPYGFFAIVEYDHLEEVSMDSYHTVILESKNAAGEVVSSMPIQMGIFETDSNMAKLVTDFIALIDSKVGEGCYHFIPQYPLWQGYLIYAEAGGNLEIRIDEFYGDFNFDGFVNAKDFAMLAGFWNKDITHSGYDLIYDGTRDGKTDVEDLRLFLKNWFAKRDYIVYNFEDYALFANLWLLEEVSEADLSSFMNNWLK